MQTMAETASESTTIAAPPEVVWQIVLDIERYPEWAHDVKDATVIRRDEQGRPAEVEFRRLRIALRPARLAAGHSSSIGSGPSGTLEGPSCEEATEAPSILHPPFCPPWPQLQTCNFIPPPQPSRK